MSAWIVSKAHIDCLVQAMIADGLVPMEKATAIGRELWSENHRSINYRYGERGKRPPYEFRGVEAPLDDWVVFKQAHCYDYQTCEHPTYEKSRSHRLITALCEKIMPRLGVTSENYHEHPGWQGGPWGIERIKQAIATAA